MSAPSSAHRPASRRAMRLAVLLSHPVQYYSPWFRWIATHTDLRLRVFYLWDAGATERVDPRFGIPIRWDTDLLSGYESEFVPNRSPRPHTDTFAGLINPAAPARLAAWQPDAILMFGYRFATHLLVLAWAKARGIPVIFRGDSHLLGRPNPPMRTRLALSHLYARFAAFACPGQAHRDYLRAFGVPEARIFRVPHAVNQEHFGDDQGLHAAEAARQRAELGIAPTQKVVLFSGKFHAEKNPAGLLRAFATLAPRDCTLVLAGNGPEEASLRTLASSANQASIRFLPFANQAAMPGRLLLGDIFCLPSNGLHETWGLAVNEAMHMGLPCLVSDRVGCQRDLVTDGMTGWVFESNSESSLREKLAQALDSDLGAMGRRAREHASGFSYEAATTGLLQAIQSSLPAGGPAST